MDMKNERPPLIPCKGEDIYVLRLAVSQLRQRDFSLFTFHYSLFTKEKVTPILHSSFLILHFEDFFISFSTLTASETELIILMTTRFLPPTSRISQTRE